jgi:predicted Zn-dependent protease
VAVAADRFDFEFFAVPDPGINAFALPGGFIGVNTGLVLLAQSESELASVLAHEITHVTQRHYTRSLAGQQRSLLYSLAALAVAVAASRSGSSSAGQATSAAIASSQALAIQTQLNYTREHEYEADRIGYQRLVSAGFDPNSMAVFMDRLQKSGRFSDSNAVLPALAPDHLRTRGRSPRAHGEPYRQVRDSLDFHLVRALLGATPAPTARPSPISGPRSPIASSTTRSRPATGWCGAAARPRHPAREAGARDAEQEAPAHPMIDAMAGHVLLEAGEFPAAVTRFEQALAKYPNKMQLVYDYPDALNRAGRGADAVAFVDLQLVRFPGNGPLHRIAARVYGAQGKRLLQHRHQGEYYAWAGDLRGAVLQMELAAKAADGDFYQSSVVETRLRALRRDLAEQQAAMAKSG